MLNREIPLLRMENNPRKALLKEKKKTKAEVQQSSSTVEKGAKEEMKNVNSPK